MTEQRLEVADVFRQYGEAFLKRWGHTVSSQQRKALRDIGACRTAALGGHLEHCDGCPHEVIAYNSCRNRSCPKCQSTARDRWLAERAKEQGVTEVVFDRGGFPFHGRVKALAEAARASGLKF